MVSRQQNYNEISAMHTLIKSLTLTFFLASLISCEENPTGNAKEVNGFALFEMLLNDLDGSELSLSNIQNFVDTLSVAPLIQGEEAYFIRENEADHVFLAGDFNQWKGNWGMTKVEGTDIWYYKKVFFEDARLEYKFIDKKNGNDNWVLDPKNPETALGGYGLNSVLSMPAYLFPEEVILADNSSVGSLKPSTISSEIMNTDYKLDVYLPHDFDESNTYETVYFQDGSDYLNFGRAKTVLDNTIHQGKIPSIIAIFVSPNDRNSEYAFENRNNYRRFFVEELVPFIESNYPCVQKPESRAVIGDSFGGNISAQIAFNHPDVFGNCGIHSGAFFPNNFETNTLITESELLPIRLANFWGTYEEGLTQNMRVMNQVFQSKGFELASGEFHEGHSWGFWQGKIDDMLIHFFKA